MIQLAKTNGDPLMDITQKMHDYMNDTNHNEDF
jgi:hypothetical protein